ELEDLLKQSPVNLDEVAELIATDPSLSAHVIKLSNSEPRNESRQITNIRDAVAAMGPERLRTLMLTCSLLEYTDGKVSSTDVQAIWHHSTLTALLSELIARRVGYAAPETAYLAGLLHDLGYLAFLVVLASECPSVDHLFVEGSEESLQAERALFGMDHCQAGAWLGRSWNFSAALTDVLAHHHAPGKATWDHQLVSIVAAADQFCRTRGVTVSTAGAEAAAVNAEDREFLQDFLSLLDPSSDLTSDLEDELLRYVRAPGFRLQSSPRM